MVSARAGILGRLFAIAIDLGLHACASAPAGPADTAAAETARAAAAPRASRLIAPMRGWYAIYRDGERVGTERFEITHAHGVWRTKGTVELDDPVELTHGYELMVDAATEEPLGVDVWVEIAGARERALGVVEHGALVVELDTVAGRGKGRVPYAPGTVLDFASPLANTLALSLLLPELEAGHSAHVRTIALPMPLLAPAVVLQRYTVVAAEADVRKVTVDQEHGRARPTALWVRPDGLPVRVRTWPEGGGAPYEMWLHAGDEADDQNSIGRTK